MIFDVMLKAFLSACGAGVLTLMVISIKWLIKRISADDLTMKALAHDAYYRHARHLLIKDAVTEEEFENHDYLYRAYKSQGLNGTGDRLHALVMEKPITERDSDIYEKLP